MISVQWFEFSWPYKPVERSNKPVVFLKPVEKAPLRQLTCPWICEYNLSWSIFPFVRLVGNRFSWRLAFRFPHESLFLHKGYPAIHYVYAMSIWGGVHHTEFFKTLERQRCRAARIIFWFLTHMPTFDVLATVLLNGALKHICINVLYN